MRIKFMCAALLGALIWVVGAVAEIAPATAATGYITANTGTASVSVFAGLPSGLATHSPSQQIAGTATLLSGPNQVARHGGLLYLTNSAVNRVTIYPATATGNVAPSQTISGAATGLSNPQGIAVDSAGHIFVANAGANSITEYAANVNGNMAPMATISGAATRLSGPKGLAVDGDGTLFVANHVGGTVTEYAAGATGNVAPLRTITAPGGLTAPEWLAIDSFDDVTVTQAGVYRTFAAGAAATPIDGGDVHAALGGVAIVSDRVLFVSIPGGDYVTTVSVQLHPPADRLPAGSMPGGVALTGPTVLGATATSTVVPTVGAGYSEHTLVYGGVPPYTWTVSSGTLPAGLTLDAGTGAVAGTPRSTGTTTFTLKATDSGSPASSVTVTRTLTIRPAIQPAVYVANGGNSLVNAFALSSSGNVAPLTSFGPANGINAPDGLGFDPAGHLFVANYGPGTVTEYLPGAAGQPIASQGGMTTPSGIAVSPPFLWVSQQAANAVGRFTLNPTSGLIDPGLANLVGPDTGLSAPAGMVFAGGLLWVANSGNDSLTAYAPGDDNDARPTRTIAGNLTGLAHPAGVAVDAAGNLLVANQFGPSITVYPATANGNVIPTRTISGPDTRLTGPSGIDLDAAGRIYVANGFASLVTVYAANANSNAAPVATYAGSNTGLRGPATLAVTPPLSILTARLPAGRVHHRYRVRLRAAEGTTPYRWTLRRGHLPRGLRLSRRGVISGRPRHAGRYRFTVRLRDSSRPRVTVTARLTLRVRRR